MNWSPMSLPKEKGRELSPEVRGGENTCRRPSCPNKYRATTDLPPSASKNTMQKVYSPLPKDGAATKAAVPEEQQRFSLTIAALGAPSPGDGHGFEAGVPLGDGFLDGGALGTHPQAVAGVLYVAPCRDNPDISHPKPHQLISLGVYKEKPFPVLPLFIFPSAVIFGLVRDGGCQEAAGEDAQHQHPGMTPLHPQR